MQFIFGKKKENPKYRIIHDEELGYMPLAYDSLLYEWRIVGHEATTVNSFDRRYVDLYRRYWCDTEEEAGKRLNRYSSAKSAKVVWEGS